MIRQNVDSSHTGGRESSPKQYESFLVSEDEQFSSLGKKKNREIFKLLKERFDDTQLAGQEDLSYIRSHPDEFTGNEWRTGTLVFVNSADDTMVSTLEWRSVSHEFKDSRGYGFRSGSAMLENDWIPSRRVVINKA